MGKIENGNIERRMDKTENGGMERHMGRTENGDAEQHIGRTENGDAECYMGEALRLAAEAAEAGEVPVGCVIVRNGAVIGRGRNRREELQSTAAHAEMEAIAEANRAVDSWRLDDCELYVTLEPCPMCAGAILNGRVRRVWYGARDEAMGACGGVMNLFWEDYPHPPALRGGILGGECREILSRFFRDLRQREQEPQGEQKLPKEQEP